jgi:hypothetical protein
MMKATELKFQKFQTFQSSTVGTHGTLETSGNFSYDELAFHLVCKINCSAVLNNTTLMAFSLVGFEIHRHIEKEQ